MSKRIRINNGTFRWLESKKLWEYRVRYQPLEKGGKQERKSFYGAKQKICRDKAREFENTEVGLILENMPLGE